MTRTLIVRSRGRCLLVKVTTPSADSMQKYLASLKSEGYRVTFKSAQNRARFSRSSGR